VLLLIVGAAAAVLVRDIRDVDLQLQAAQQSFEQARDALATGDVDGSSAGLQEARRHLGDATSRVNRLAWRAAERVPIAGNSLRSVSAMVGVADETARLGRLVVEGARDLIGQDGRLDIQTRDGAIPLAPFVQTADALADADTRTLRAELARLGAVPQLLVPDRVAGARERSLSAGTEVADTLEAAQELMAAVPTLLGAEGSRRYFLAMENPAELRGTGGLVGFFATVDVVDGRMRLSQPQSYEALDAQNPEEADGQDPDSTVEEGDGQATSDPDENRPPGRGDPFGSERLAASVSEEFAARYADTDADRFFGNVNVHPDLPTTASIMADLYRIRTGQQVDGVISINPIGLAILLQATGDVTLSDAIAATAPDLPNPVPVAQVPTITMFGLYEVFQGRNAARRDWLREFATSAFDSVFDAQWDGVEMARQVGAAIGAGHLAIHVADPQVQAALEALDAAGALTPPDPSRDHVALIGNNASGNKLDFHMGHRITGTVWLAGDRDLTSLSRTLDLTVDLVHEFDPEGRSAYVAGSFDPGAFLDPPAPRGPFGLNRTWFSTWVPGAAVIHLDGQAVDAPRFGVHTVVDRTLEVTFGQTQSFHV
jgi:hypothetical protein